jgi:hypothetical protein
VERGWPDGGGRRDDRGAGVGFKRKRSHRRVSAKPVFRLVSHVTTICAHLVQACVHAGKPADGYVGLESRLRAR